MSNICPICNKLMETKCERCGFEVPTPIFLSETDANDWYKNILDEKIKERIKINWKVKIIKLPMINKATFIFTFEAVDKQRNGTFELPEISLVLSDEHVPINDKDGKSDRIKKRTIMIRDDVAIENVKCAKNTMFDLFLQEKDKKRYELCPDGSVRHDVASLLNNNR